MTKTRIERDSLGEVLVPVDALYGAQTQRAVDNFPVSGQRLPGPFLEALALIKQAAALANAELGLLDPARAQAIADAAGLVALGRYHEQFPVDVYQTGSGTSSNMNMNEVLATLASRACGEAVHPNDHVNMGQSSNDVIPSAIHVACVLQLHLGLLPALDHLYAELKRRAKEFEQVVKTGRTHLMDALPITLGQEIGAWAAQVYCAGERLRHSLPHLAALPLGGTAVGTGVNAHPEFAARACKQLDLTTGESFRPADYPMARMAGIDALVELSGQLRALAVTLHKLANDLRWMNSGPLAGLAEIALPALQPGSSIMPGKVNPVIPEMVLMVCAQVMGHDAAIAFAGTSGNFQLNTMQPLVAANLLDSLNLLANAVHLLADKAVAGFTVNEDVLEHALARNPILVTALNTRIGYEQAAAIAKQAYAQQRPVLDVAVEMSGLAREELEALLDPRKLTEGGIPEGGAVSGG
ncbi:MAG: class II fumarate hydratase [Gammaproteobacteria bacterium]|nr:class II fumarate hydratase [Gammaproteobacteria bacterium]